MYLISLVAHTVSSALSAVSSSISMLIIVRKLANGASSTATPTGAGVVADLWEIKEKGGAISVYCRGILLGPSLGPGFGGLLTQRWGWAGNSVVLDGIRIADPAFGIDPPARDHSRRYRTQEPS